MFKQRFKLSTIITFFVCIVVLLSLVITDILVSNTTSNNIRNSLEEKAEIVSRTVARSPIVIQGLQSNKEPSTVQSYTMDIQQAAEVLFVVVFDMNGIRLSHPNPNLIGERFVGGDEQKVLRGEEYISVSEGTLGKSLRAFAPIYGKNNEQVGAVAVGISLANVEEALERNHKNIIIGSVIGVLVGIIGAFLLASYIKRMLFGLEPFQIARIHEERNWMLQSVHEGIVAVDKHAKVTLINKSALNILRKAGITGDPFGMAINDYLPQSQLDRVLETGKAELDEEQIINGISVIVNRAPLIVNNEVVGAISTFRDKTEVDRLAEQLTGVRTYVETLRAQTHEFMNKLHVILGMVKMGFHDELADYIKKIVDHQADEFGNINRNIKDPALAGFLIGKLSYAREAHVKLTLNSNTAISEPKSTEVTDGLITILGNLIDNAIESMGGSDIKTIDVLLLLEENQLTIKVSDTGTGISQEYQNQIFKKGISTKGENRGFGLYLVQQSVEKLGGRLNLKANQPKGSVFLITIPYKIKGGKDD